MEKRLKLLKNDMGERIRSRLVCPMIALDILRSYSNNKISDELKQFLEWAKEDIGFVAQLSWTLSRDKRGRMMKRKGGRHVNIRPR